MSQSNDHVIISSKIQPRTPSHTLARVRNNQRRHRERRRQYIASLEQKVEATEGLLAQARADIGALKAELEELRNGISGHMENLDGFSTASELTLRVEIGEQRQKPNGGDVARASSTPAPFSHSNPENALISNAATPIMAPSLPTTVNSNLADLSTLAIIPPSRACSTSTPLSPEHSHSSETTSSAVHRLRCCSLVGDPPTTAFSDTLRATSTLDSEDYLALLAFDLSACTTYPSSDAESTTPCSQAYVIIAQQNFRGLNAHTIRNWLYRGFRRAKAEAEAEGCRVENNLLFGLLDFISSV